MKRKYVEPQTKFVATRASGALADVCWAYGKNGKEFFYNTSGPGYVKINMQAGNGCDGSTIASIQWYDPSISGYTDATAAQIAEVQAGVDMATGNSAEPFKGSPFSNSVDSSWS
ncbi:MAG: hypothetical protein PUB20_07985 [Clostridia bacterium]|nr:hypothetical protein [Clostridia bacterium]